MSAAGGNSAYRHITGMGELNALLMELPKEVRAVALASAVKDAAQPLKLWQKRYARRSERTGALRDSIDHKIKVYRETGTAVAIVGPNRNYYISGQKIAKGKLITEGADRPAHYAHLIEFGHHAVVPRKGTTLRKGTAKLAKKSWVPPIPFVRPAVVMARTEMATAFDVGMTRGIEKAVAKIKSSVGAT